MKKIILDTDIGTDIDDALCLSYLLKHPECELLGITTVSGEAKKRAMLANAICKHIKKDVPIYVGAEMPLLTKTMQPIAQQAKMLERWEHDEKFSDYHAVEFMHKAILENPYEITLLAIGPLTNIALLFSMYPETQVLLKELVLMCGKFYAETAPEWNAKCDPYASAIVYASNVENCYSIGLDVTMQVLLTKEKQKKKSAGTGR